MYYHLGSLQDSLLFALNAGSMFDVRGTSEYTETIICELYLSSNITCEYMYMYMCISES